MSIYEIENNGNKHQLTIEEIRKQPEFSNLTDQEALELGNSLRILSELTFEAFTNEHRLNSIPKFS